MPSARNVDNFKDHPKTLGEARSDKSSSAADWSPRDALVNLLRSIDDGSEEIESLVVCFKRKGNKPTGFCTATPNAIETLGLLEITKFRMRESV